jgi:hypothetical protein
MDSKNTKNTKKPEPEEEKYVLISINDRIIRGREDLTQIDVDIKREVAGKRMIQDKATGKMKEVDAYDRPEPATKKKVDSDKVRAMLSSNVE